MLDKLKAPFEPSRISWRVGSTTGDKTKGQALAYIDARDVMERLDSVCGPGNWQDKYEYFGPTAICYLSIRMSNGEWITKADGAGDTQVEAEKGRISDAFKRAAVKWGIGRYLYDIDSPWVELEPRGKSYVIAKKEYTKLEGILKGAKIQTLPEDNLVKDKDRKPMPDDEYTKFCNAINAAKTIDELAKVYNEGQKKSLTYGDKPAQEGLAKLKDIRKEELTTTTENNNVVTE